MSDVITLNELIQNQLLSALTLTVGFFIALILNKFVDWWNDQRVYERMLAVIIEEAKSNKIILETSFKQFAHDDVILRGYNLQAVSVFITNPLFVTHAKGNSIEKIQAYQRSLALANRYREKIEQFCFEKPAGTKEWEKQTRIFLEKNLIECDERIDDVINLNPAG